MGDVMTASIITCTAKKLKRFQGPFERFVFPLVLLLWPLATANQGINIQDTTYSLGNFRFLGDGVESTWFFATFLANEVGRLLSSLPVGSAMIGMNLATGLLISLTALAVYFGCRRIFPGWMLFLGEFLAESLCWCPSVILYNTLTYLLLTLACVFLFLAVNATLQGPGWYILAGICLGLNVLVRLSNLTQAVLIVAVWFSFALRRNRHGRAVRAVLEGGSMVPRKTAADPAVRAAHRAVFGEAVHRTIDCLLGYGIGFFAGWLLSAAQYGPSAYFRMIPQLLGMTDSAQDYTAGGMLTDILRAYGTSLRWFLILIPCVLAGFLLFHLPLIRRHPRIGRAVYFLGMLVLLRFYWGHGMFTTVFSDYWCMYQWGMFFVILSLVCDVCMAAGLASANEDERFLAVLSILLILILPLGSNNYTFPILGCLFFLAPVTLWFLRRFWQATRAETAQFSWHALACMIVCMTLGTGALFHLNFAFGDGTDGTPRTAVTEIPYLRGMHTTPDHAAQLTALYLLMRDRNCAGRTLLAYGNAPGLNLILSMKPAIDTTWPDLDSYPADNFRAALDSLHGMSAQSLPVVVWRMDDGEAQGTAVKDELVRQFLAENSYGKPERLTEGTAEYQVWFPADLAEAGER